MINELLVWSNSIILEIERSTLLMAKTELPNVDMD